MIHIRCSMTCRAYLAVQVRAAFVQLLTPAIITSDTPAHHQLPQLEMACLACPTLAWSDPMLGWPVHRTQLAGPGWTGLM